MTLLPVIQRELLSQSRQPATYWLRILATTALAGTVWLTMARWQGQSGIRGTTLTMDPRIVGTALFGNLNLAMLLVLWFLMPLLAADAISRERREGTLGLLLLTPLGPGGVVLGKVAAHVFRALTVFLAMLPWLMFAVLTGGVSWRDVAMAAIINASVLFLALSAGLLASSCSDDWLKNALFAVLLAGGLGLAGLGLHRGALANVKWRMASGRANAAAPGWTMKVGAWGGAGSYLGGEGVFNDVRSLVAFASNSQLEVGFNRSGQAASVVSDWSDIWTNYPVAVQNAWFVAAGLVLGLSLVVFALAALAAAYRVAGSWRDAPRRPGRRQLARTFLAPRFAGSLFRSRMRRTLERNPIGWLQQRSPQARLVKWGWCLGIMFLVILLSADVFDLPAGMAGLQVLLLLSLALSAAGSFRHERESGAFELLLVTPLSVDQIIAGRLRGLWMQFLPAAAILLFSIATVGSLGMRGGDEPPRTELAFQAVHFGCAFIGVSVVGLWLSTRRLHYMAAWLLTCGLVLIAPHLPAISFRSLNLLPKQTANWLIWLRSTPPSLVISGLQLLLALGAWLALRHHLARRRFVLS